MKILTALFLFISTSLQARDIYVSALGGTDGNTGLTPSTAYQTLAKVNSVLGAGDFVYLKRGETYFGSLIIANKNDVTIDAYGSGSLPLISAFVTMSGWQSSGNGIWSVVVPSVKETCNMLTIDSYPQRVARHPDFDAANGGFLTFNSPVDTTSFNIDIAGDYIGKQATIKPSYWRQQKVIITSYSGGIMTYARTLGLRDGGAQRLENVITGNGVFFQRDSAYLTKFGEFHVDSATKRVRAFFGANNPASYVVKVAVLDTGLNVGSASNLLIQNIAFEGFNFLGIRSDIGNRVWVQNCSFTNMGGKAISLYTGSDNRITDCTFKRILSNAITASAAQKDSLTITGNIVDSVGYFDGMGSLYSGSDYDAISGFARNNLYIAKNVVTHTGLSSITFQGSNLIVEKNIADTACLNGADRGLIYSYEDPAVPTVYTNRIIRNNYLSNSIGNIDGTTGKTKLASGVYLDGRYTEANVYDNVISGCNNRGVVVNSGIRINVKYNTIYDCFSGILYTKLPTRDSINVNIIGNTFYSFPTRRQGHIRYDDSYISSSPYTIPQAVLRAGIVDSNYYNAVTFAAWKVEAGLGVPSPARILTGWQLFKQDLNSKSMPDVDKSQTLVLFNDSDSERTYSLSGKYIDGKGGSYNGSITIPAWTGKLLIYESATTENELYLRGFMWLQR
jgi:hypothetical protein